MQDVAAVNPARKRFKMTTDIPAAITTPDRVETRIGTLEFFDGFPTEKKVELVYDNLDFMRGVESFLTCIPSASINAMRRGFRDLGISRNNVIGITENLMDSRSLYLTPNTESV